MSDVIRVKEKADIVDVLSSYIQLVPSGKSFKGKCPFHNEKTPSFFVSPERQNYYCFGCGAKGDVLSFVEQYEGLDFPGALKLLADKYGVTLQRMQGNRDDTSRLYALMESATDFFEQKLTHESSVQAYLKQRGISDSLIKKWRIGFAPDAWRDVYDTLIAQKFTEKELLNGGVIRASEKGDKMIDVFRNRIMFPIRDISGRVIAFSGRTVSQEKNVPKYVNSPETPLFRKSLVLFGLYEARQAIRKQGYAILVEGQFDVLVMHDKGLLHTVASSGTAFTTDQAVILKRLAPRVMFLYDGDEAGDKAALRGAEIALEVGLEVKIARLPHGLDPADAGVSQPDVLKQSLRQADHVIHVAGRLILESESRPERQVFRMTEEVLPLIARLPSESLRDHFSHTVARMFDVSPESVMRDLSQKKLLSRDSQTVRMENKEVPRMAEERILKILHVLYGTEAWLVSSNQYASLCEHVHTEARRILGLLSDADREALLAHVDTTAGAFESERMHEHMKEKDIRTSIDDLLKHLHIEVLRRLYKMTTDPAQQVLISKEIDTLQTS